jgi:hypothetical protein
MTFLRVVFVVLAIFALILLGRWVVVLALGLFLGFVLACCWLPRKGKR